MDPSMLDDAENCKLCGEDPDFEMGIFWDKIRDESVWAHAQCGIDAGLSIA
jgi:hypothetical protein